MDQDTQRMSTMNNQLEVVETVQQLRAATQRLSEASKQVFKLAKERAVTERVYRMELAKEIATLRHQGVQATLIPDLARGHVAELKEERDFAHEMHRSAMSSIGALQVEIQSWQSILRIMDEVEK